jgi:enoyl-[acyl-carrier-protein] reductase (NADH)
MSDESPLLITTRQLINDRPAKISIKMIADEIGKTSAWVNMIANGDIKNPGINSIQKLHDYLQNNKV